MSFIPNTTEIVYQVPRLEDVDLLRQHYHLFYKILANTQIIPEARWETVNGVNRCLSGVNLPYYNAVMGVPNPSGEWDQCITQQLYDFKAYHIPFVWYVDEEASPEFKEKLVAHGFKDAGILRGVIGSLNASISIPKVPENYVWEEVRDEQNMEAFNDCLCEVFGFQGEDKAASKRILGKANQGENPLMFHWVAKKEDRVVSTISTLIQGDTVSFWNGATIPHERRQGISSALRCVALQHAMARGCRVGMSFLLVQGMALGICTKLGYQTKWRFHAFLSPL